MSNLRQKLLKPWVIMPLVAVIALGGWYLSFRPKGSGTGATNAAAQRTYTATKGTLAKTVSADGTIAAADTDDLSFTSAGTVTAVNVAAGDHVKKGQVLASIDPTALQAAVTSAESSVSSAQATLSDDTDAGAGDAQLTADQSALDTANDTLADARSALEGANLVATFDGTVAAVNITKGDQLSSDGTDGTSQTGSGSGSGASASTLGSSSAANGRVGATGATSPSSGSSSGSSTAQIEVVSSGRFTVDVDVDDTDVANVKVGQVATINVSTSTSTSRFGGFGGGFGGRFGGGATATTAAGGTTTTTIPLANDTGAKGLVTAVGKVADASSGVASYPVTVAFADSSGTYNVGATVTVAITYAEVQDAVEIPAFAVATGADGTQTVTVSADGKEQTRTITTGLTSGNLVQVTSGLQAGEVVVLDLGGFGGRAGGTRTGTGAGGGAGGGGGGGFTPPAGFNPPAGFTPGGGS